MSTGAIAILLSVQPFTFNGLRTIGKIFFILDLVLFITFSALIINRFIVKGGKSALIKSLHHPLESFYFGAFWISLDFIIYCIQQYGVASCGPWLVKTLEVLFWAFASCAILVVIFQYHVIFDEEHLPTVHAMPVWILPAYPFLVLGPLAATLEYSQPRTSALPILIGGILFQGLGWTIAFFMYTLYITRLVNSSLPEPSKMPGMFVAVGPAAYTSTTLVQLGVQAQSVLPNGFLGITSVPTGDLWKAVGVPIGIFLWLVGFWFFAISAVSNIINAKKMSFTLNMWSIVFPNVGLTIALIQIGQLLDSDGIRGVGSAMTILLVIAWLLIAAGNIRAVWTRQILWPGQDEDGGDVEGHRSRRDKEA